MAEQQQSSEEVKEQDLAQEALDATREEDPPVDESAKKEEPTVPLHEHTALRQRAQTAEVARARAEGKVAAMEHQRTVEQPAPKSPLQSEIERQTADGILEEDMTVSPKIIKEQELYNQQVANQTAEASRKEQLDAQRSISGNKAMAVHDDWQNVMLAADGLMTEGELLDIANAGENFGEKAYTTAQGAIERNKPVTETTETAPEKKQSESEADVKKEKVPTQQEILKDLDVDPVIEAASLL